MANWYIYGRSSVQIESESIVPLPKMYMAAKYDKGDCAAELCYGSLESLVKFMTEELGENGGALIFNVPLGHPNVLLDVINLSDHKPFLVWENYVPLEDNEEHKFRLALQASLARCLAE